MDPDSFKYEIPLNISASFHHGYLVPHHRLVSYFTKEYINGFDIAFSRYMPELKPVNPPEMGGGYYFSNLGSKDIYGYAHALYFYVARDFLKNKSPFNLQSTMGIGASFNTRRWDLSENYSNRNIGSHVNIFFMYSLNLKARIGEKLVISAGPSVVHTSNGNLRQPNFGLNLLTTHLTMSYTLEQKRKTLILPVLQSVNFSKNRYLVLLSGGARQLSHRMPDYFGTGSLIAEYSRRINSFVALGLGTDFIYDPTEGREMYVTGVRTENIVPWHIGAHVSFERTWNHLSFVINSGYKIITPSDHLNYQYNRVGIRYRFDNNLVLNYSLKSHKIVADFIEFGIGYVFE
jgi:hypothetical protein